MEKGCLANQCCELDRWRHDNAMQGVKPQLAWTIFNGDIFLFEHKI
jgi:hypothetical protein